MTWGFRNGITLGIWTQKCPCNWRLNFFFQISQICPLKALGQKYGKIWGFLGSRTPKMAISHLVRTIRVGKNQKKEKKFWPPLVCNNTVVWPICTLIPAASYLQNLVSSLNTHLAFGVICLHNIVGPCSCWVLVLECWKNLLDCLSKGSCWN